MSDSPLGTPPVVSRLTDGNWHRLHPATPLLRGGFFLIAVIGYLVANLRERLIALFVPGQESQGDPIDLIVRNGLVPLAIVIVIAVLIVIVAAFYLSWRMHSFRITDEVVEVRSGILFRTNRKGRLDRVQGIEIVRPFFARLFGAAKLEIDVAGHDAHIHLSYLSGAHADGLRRDILRLASGSRLAETDGLPRAVGGVLDQRVAELLGPELDPNEAPPQSVVAMHPGRLIGSILLSETMVVFLVIIVGLSWVVASTGRLLPLVGLLPSLLGIGSYLVRRFTKSLRYTVAATPDGIRVGHGLLSTSNETLPPGRIHSVEVSQSILWRPAGWWTIRVNRAARATGRGAGGERGQTTILPVGNLDEVVRVLPLLLPQLRQTDIIRAGLSTRAKDTVFTNSPRRAAVVRLLSWRRNGFALQPELALLRTGSIWRRLVIVPESRIQSVAVHQGPLLRALRLASVHLHTVHGPIVAKLGGVDAATAVVLFSEVADGAVSSAASDRSHRWRAGETELA